LNPLLFALLALDLGGAAHDLARNVAAAVAHEPVTLNVRNLSALGPAEIAEIRRAFDAELRPGGPAEVHLTVSENLTHFLLVAEIRRGVERRILVETWPRSPSAESRPASVTLEKKLLWQQDQPILDVAPSDGALVVLDNTRVLLVRGVERKSAALPSVRAWPRDMRGRLTVDGSTFTAWLPGVVCQGRFDPQPSLACEESKNAAPIAPGATASLATARNFFEGVVAIDGWGAHDMPAFYSAARAGEVWVFTGVDGRAHIYMRAWELAGMIEQWGSDAAGVETPCGPRILATRPGDGPDAIRPYDLMASVPNPAGPAIEFPGPVTALWSNGVSATAVVRNLETGSYAAYSLVPACRS